MKKKLKTTKKTAEKKTTKKTMQNSEVILKDGQIVEVDFNKDLVIDYENNYIMEEEGIGADDEMPYDLQTTFNTDTPEEMVDGDTVIEYEES